MKITIFLHTEKILEKSIDFFLVHILNKSSYNNGRYGILKAEMSYFAKVNTWSTFSQQMLTYSIMYQTANVVLVRDFIVYIRQRLLTKC